MVKTKKRTERRTPMLAIRSEALVLATGGEADVALVWKQAISVNDVGTEREFETLDP